MDWSRRACSRRGHVLYEPEEQEYLDQVRADTALGTVWRCLRCGDFVLDVPTGGGPAAAAPMPLRGPALRSRFIMRLLALERIFRFLLVGLGAYAVWKFSNSQHALQLLFERNLTIFRPVAQHYGYDLDNSSVVTTIRKLFTYKHADLDIAAAALAVYAVIELIEAVGLWLAKRWGEYFAVVATGLFLPVEVYELTEHATKFKIATLALNVLAVLYLLMSKRLFGIRGGGKAYRAELTSESLLHGPEIDEADADAEAGVAAGTGLGQGPGQGLGLGAGGGSGGGGRFGRTAAAGGYDHTPVATTAVPSAGNGVGGIGPGLAPNIGEADPPQEIVQA
jgi:uncharacterized membrane protein (DUF2068 family)